MLPTSPTVNVRTKVAGQETFFFLAQSTVKNELNINFSNTLKDRKANIHV